MFEGKDILITGGTGSFGKAYSKYLLEHAKPKRLVIFSRDEQKHYTLMQELKDWSGIVQFIIGDLRDREQVFKATKGIDYVVHSAAMKHMPMAEDHPLEAIKTNLLGTQNLIDACIENGIKKVVALSTDKAALPINVYGASKMILERLFIAADRERTNPSTRFSVVRYANVFGSKGSVVPLFLKLRETGELPITHPDMSRFSISMAEGIDLVEFAMKFGLGGEIVVPIAPSYTVGVVAEAIGPDCIKKIIGPRQAEKMHEVIISEFEMPLTIRKDKFYIITPENGRFKKEQYIERLKAIMVSGLSEYSSGNNTDWLTVKDIQDQLSTL